MIDLIYIHKKNREFLTDSCFNLYSGCKYLHYPFKFFESSELESLPLTKNTMVSGGVGIVRKALNKLNIEEPNVPCVPDELFPFFGRKIWETTLGEIRRDDIQDIFIKPLVNHKLFNGHVRTDNVSSLSLTAQHGDDIKVLASEVVNFISEYRCFVHNNTLVGCKHYFGDFTKLIDFELAEKCIKAYTKAPIAYSLDIGITLGGINLPVEVNDSFALGSYGLNPIIYTQMITDRWQEIVGTLV